MAMQSLLNGEATQRLEVTVLVTGTKDVMVSEQKCERRRMSMPAQHGFDRHANHASELGEGTQD
jgi:hypothetical protein